MSIGSLVNRLLVPPENIASQKTLLRKQKYLWFTLKRNKKSDNLKGKYIIL